MGVGRVRSSTAMTALRRSAALSRNRGVPRGSAKARAMAGSPSGGAATRNRQLSILLSDDGKVWQRVYTHNGKVFYGHTDKKPLMCKRHPEYGDIWAVCGHDGCSRRTMLMDPEWEMSRRFRWHFPDLWKQDRKRWYLFKPRACEAVAAPEAQAAVYER